MSEIDSITHKHKFSFARVLMIIVPVAAIAGIAYSFTMTYPEHEQRKLENESLRALLGIQTDISKLASDLSDANGDLIADPPNDESKFFKPNELFFSYIASSDTEADKTTWAEFTKMLSEALGIPVTLVSSDDVDAQIAAMRAGKLHFTAFGTGDAEHAVNQAGFVPLACFADADGNHGYTMKIIVPASSKLTSVDQIRGHLLTFTRPSSNSGCVAPLVFLMKEHKLRPDADYNYGLSRSHENSIRGVASGKTEIAAVASDILDRMIATDEIKHDSFKVLYESGMYPPGVFGYTYNLDPKVAEKIVAQLKTFKFAGTGLEKTFGGAGSKEFAMIDYKKDWEPIRKLHADAVEIIRDLTN